MKKFNEFINENKINEEYQSKMTPSEFLDGNGIEDKVVHVRHKMGGDIEVKLSDVLEDYKEHLEVSGYSTPELYKKIEQKRSEVRKAYDEHGVGSEEYEKLFDELHDLNMLYDSRTGSQQSIH